MSTTKLIAEFFIAKAEIDGVEITNSKLQELLYCSQGIALAKLGESLFDECIIVGKFGPEVPSIQKITSKYSYNPMAIDAPKDKIRKASELGKDIEIILNDIWCMLGHLNVWELSEFISQEKSWRKAINGGKKTIKEDDLKKSFKLYV